MSMYAVKSYYNEEQTSLCTDNMYKVKSYYNSGDAEITSPPTTVEEIRSRQAALLQKLEKMTIQVDELYAKHCKTVSTPGGKIFNGNGVPLDLVIHANPSCPPLSVFVLYKLLSKQVNVLPASHVHSSVKTIPDGLRYIFGRGTPDRDRTQYQAAITVIWTQGASEPTLMVSPQVQIKIEGESNIARYVSRLMNPAYDDGCAIKATETDVLLDLANTIKHGATKMKASAIKSLNVRLGKSSFLMGEDLSLADVVLWSVIMQSADASKQGGNVKKWLDTCSNVDVFSLATSYVSQ